VACGATSLLNYPNSSLDFGHVLVTARKIRNWATWHLVNHIFEWSEFSIGMNSSDAKPSLEIILVLDLSEGLEYL
jgi:hypothetical protein